MRKTCTLLTCILALFLLALPTLAEDAPWYQESVAYVTTEGLMDALDDGDFAPDADTDRCIVAEALWRSAGRPAATADSQFLDIPESHPNRAAIDYCAQAGIVNGYPDGCFHPDDSVTREQFVTMLYRAAGQPDTTDTADFADWDTIASFARRAAAWCAENEIISGMPGKLFAPKTTISRAMVATILMRLDTQLPSETPRALVAYFSYTGTTQAIAESVAQAAGADLYRITPEEPYTDDILQYYDPSTRAYQEQYSDTARPAIAGDIDNLDDYTVLYLGYPIWYGQAPKILYTFLESHDLSGKTIIPFCTSGSSGIGTSATKLHACAPDATWLAGQRFAGSSSYADVAAWVDAQTP